MDKKIINNIFTKIIQEHNFQLKCPRWLRKPTNKDMLFISQFFNDNLSEEGKKSEMYYKNYVKSDTNVYEDDKQEQIDFYNKHRETYNTIHQNGEGFSMEMKDAVSDWGDDGYTLINGKIYNTADYKNFKEDGLLSRDEIKNLDVQMGLIDEAIRISPNVKGNRIMFRGGHLDDRVNVGDVVTQKGYSSLSYDQETAEDFANDMELEGMGVESRDRYLMECYVPKGTDGLYLDIPFNSLGEYEYLTGRNTRLYVFDMDKKNRKAKVLILPFDKE